MIGGIEYKQLSYIGVSYAELSRYPLIMLERKSISRLCIDFFFDKAGISLSPVLELGSLDLIISFVRNNMGLAFIPMELCGQFIDNNEIFQIRLENPLPVRGIGLIETINPVHSNAAEKFKEIILANE